MATAQYDAAQGAPKQSITVITGSAISGAVSVTVDTAKPKRDCLLELELIRCRIVEGKWPPV